MLVCRKSYWNKSSDGDDGCAKGDSMTHKIIHTLVAAALGTLAMTGVAQTIAPSQNDTSAVTKTDQDRLPASKADSSGPQSSSSTATSTGPQSSSSTATSIDQRDAAPATKHPPTSIMDRATPTMTAPKKQSGRKHPPTSIMDSVTPQEKSPAAGDSPSGSQTPNK
jgi:hypothetical protein